MHLGKSPHSHNRAQYSNCFPSLTLTTCRHSHPLLAPLPDSAIHFFAFAFELDFGFEASLSVSVALNAMSASFSGATLKKGSQV